MPLCAVCSTEVDEYANGKKCRSCYNEYMAEYMLNRYHKRRTEALERLGGRCAECGSTDDLEFDHIDRTLKSGYISKMFSQSEKRYKDELEKCQLLCSGCHQRKTISENTVGHGGGLTGIRNCYCDECKPLKKSYMKDWREKNKSR